MPVKDQLRIYCQSLGLLLSLSIPIGAVMYFGGKIIIPMVYGIEYANAIPVFSLMGLLIVLFFVNSLPGNIIHNSNKVKKFVPFSFLNFLVALVGCLILIPKMGVIGGVWAMIIGESFGLVINNIFAFRILNEKS